MNEVFISYKREDERRVGRLVRALERAGVSVWWDRELPGGESWRAQIQAALEPSAQESTVRTAALARAINLRTAKALGLTIPPLLLLRADQVIE